MRPYVSDLTGSKSMRELATIENIRAAKGYVGELATLDTFRAVGIEIIKRTDARLGLLGRAEAILDLLCPPAPEDGNGGAATDDDSDADSDCRGDTSSPVALAKRASRVPQALTTHVLRTLTMRLSSSATLRVTVVVAQDVCLGMMDRLRVTNLWHVLAQMHLAEAKRLAETPWDRSAVAGTASRLAILLGGLVETAKDRSPVAAKATRLAALLGERVLSTQPAALLLGAEAAERLRAVCSAEAAEHTDYVTSSRGIGNACIYDPSAASDRAIQRPSRSAPTRSRFSFDAAQGQVAGDEQAQFRLVVKNSFIEFVEEPSNIRRSRSADDVLTAKARRLEISSPFAIVVQCVGGGAATAWAEGSSGARLSAPETGTGSGSRTAPEAAAETAQHACPGSSPAPQSVGATPVEAPATVQPCTEEDAAPRTTVMLRPVPASYSRDLVVEMLDQAGFRGCYDFVYLPMDFTRGIGLGYALVSVLTPNIGKELIAAFTSFTTWAVPSDAVCNASWSEPRQGYAELLERYRNSPVMHSSVPDEYKPAIFADGARIAFPAPTKSIRPPRVRYLKPGESRGCMSLHKAAASARTENAH